MGKFIQLSLMVSLIFVIPSLTFSGNFEEGLKAAQTGNFEKAYRLWLAEAEKGDPFAQFNLGVMYEKGNGVSQNDQEAAKWFRKAAEAGYAAAQVNLGIIYSNGRGVLQDDKEAVNWFRKAAESGDSNAQFHLGNMYLKGQGVTKSLENAYAWWVVAAENGNEDAKNNKQVAEKSMTSIQIETAQKRVREIRSRLRN